MRGQATHTATRAHRIVRAQSTRQGDGYIKLTKSMTAEGRQGDGYIKLPDKGCMCSSQIREGLRGTGTPIPGKSHTA
jgi:hypothetical protein